MLRIQVMDAQTGSLIGIYVAPSGGAPMHALDGAELVAGRGIAGDRYHAGSGTFSPPAQTPTHEVTIVDVAEVERFNASHGAALRPGDLRRNLVTAGIDVNALVGKTFTIGETVLEGLKLCEPCSHLASLTRSDVLPGLVHRAGLRAAIRRGGVVRVGDPITLVTI